MAYIGRQQSSGAFLKLDSISSQFNGSTKTFNLTVGSRDGAKTLDLHGRKLAIEDRSGVKHTIAFNLA